MIHRLLFTIVFISIFQSVSVFAATNYFEKAQGLFADSEATDIKRLKEEGLALFLMCTGLDNPTEFHSVLAYHKADLNDPILGKYGYLEFGTKKYKLKEEYNGVDLGGVDGNSLVLIRDHRDSGRIFFEFSERVDHQQFEKQSYCWQRS